MITPVVVAHRVVIALAQLGHDDRLGPLRFPRRKLGPCLLLFPASGYKLGLGKLLQCRVKGVTLLNDCGQRPRRHFFVVGVREGPTPMPQTDGTPRPHKVVCPACIFAFSVIHDQTDMVLSPGTGRSDAFNYRRLASVDQPPSHGIAGIAHHWRRYADADADIPGIAVTFRIDRQRLTSGGCHKDDAKKQLGEPVRLLLIRLELKKTVGLIRAVAVRTAVLAESRSGVHQRNGKGIVLLGAHLKHLLDAALAPVPTTDPRTLLVVF